MFVARRGVGRYRKVGKGRRERNEKCKGGKRRGRKEGGEEGECSRRRRKRMGKKEGC